MKFEGAMRNTQGAWLIKIPSSLHRAFFTGRAGADHDQVLFVIVSH
ncbi:MAG: hypothetical protein ABSA23_15005 [Anaerolineales bacterium]|jgi:hypothetical protein